MMQSRLASRLRRCFTALLTAAFALSGMQAMAQATPSFPAGSHGEKILQRGKIIIGVRYDVPLYGFQNPRTGVVEGMEVDIGRELARALFGDPSKVEFRQVVSRTRIPMLQEGAVDAIIATLTVTRKRMEEINFSDIYYLAGMHALVPDDSPIKSVDGLKTATIAVARGGTGEHTMREMYPQAKILAMDSHGDAFQALVSRRATVLVSDDPVLQGLRERLKGFRIIPERLTFEPHAIGVAKSSPELVPFLNKFLQELKTSGKWKELYRKNVNANAPEPPQGPPDPLWLR